VRFRKQIEQYNGQHKEQLGEIKMTVTIDTINEVLNEIKRFEAMAEKAKYRLTIDKSANYGCKETGAVRRASMDLTRILVKLRKN
jgi:hypothetical protein